MKQQCGIPGSWARTTIRATAEIIRGVSFPKDARKLVPQFGHVACLRTANVQREVEWGDLWFVPEEYVKVESRYVQPLDVLISVSNSLELVGKVTLVTTLPQKTTLGAFISLLRPLSGLDAKFYYYQMASPEVQSEIRYSASTTTNISNISSSKLSEITLKVPPLPEQHRIVAEIETQFTRLDASVAALRRARANLKRYRASVLKAACEGRLVPTEAELARSEGRGYEPAGILRERILAERRGRWESQEKRRGKYKEPSAPDTSALPELPEGWVWVSLELSTQNFDGQRVPVKAEDRASMAGPYAYYGASGIIDAVNHFLFDGDFLLIAEDGANLLSRTTPIAFIARGQFWVNNHAHVVKTFGGVPLQYLEIYVNGLDIQRYVTGTAQPKLTQAALNRMPIPLPPLAEQRRIVAEVERRLSVIQQAEATVEASLARAERLRQSILKQAFSGKLVPQDPGDEPASALLERIRAEREAAQSAAPSRRKSKYV